MEENNKRKPFIDDPGIIGASLLKYNIFQSKVLSLYLLCVQSNQHLIL